MFDVLNDVTLEALIVPKSWESENLAADHFSYLHPGDSGVIGPWLPAFWVVCPVF